MGGSLSPQDEGEPITYERTKAVHARLAHNQDLEITK